MGSNDGAMLRHDQCLFFAGQRLTEIAFQHRIGQRLLQPKGIAG